MRSLLGRHDRAWESNTSFFYGLTNKKFTNVLELVYCNENRHKINNIPYVENFLLVYLPR